MLPGRIQNIWNTVGEYYIGGFPYSEGIFEDINKVIYMQLYWGKNDVRNIICEYARYEFSYKSADRITDLCYGLEETTKRMRIEKIESEESHSEGQKSTTSMPTFVIENQIPVLSLAEEAGVIENEMPDKCKNKWRWRVIRLRTLIDKELVTNKNQLNDTTDILCNELTNIFYAQNSDYTVAPVTKKSVLDNRGELY